MTLSERAKRLHLLFCDGTFRGDADFIREIESELQAAVDEAKKEVRKNVTTALKVGAECIDEAHTEGFIRGLEKAAQVIDGWHIKKGGYTELAHGIRNLKQGTSGEGGK